MGNSRAYPVLRSTAKTVAYRQARLLADLLTARREDRVHLTADLETAEDARRMAGVLPGAQFEHAETRTDPATGAYLSFALDVATADDAALRPELPLHVWASVPWGTVEDRFVAALGRGRAGIGWHGAWPDDPDADRPGLAGYDGVQILFHCDDADGERWSGRHTVFVHTTKWGDPARAAALAAHIGGTVLGEARTGW
ncbi:hypothetical protein AB0F30_35380 [Streptomyces sp. NPDC029006]|uniref:hypothetical protein n=1 Tax=Streptomyces sp. NPDC029006 TaxID=3155467 RepID=UPI0033D1AE1E